MTIVSPSKPSSSSPHLTSPANPFPFSLPFKKEQDL